jgi:peroxiredoxin
MKPLVLALAAAAALGANGVSDWVCPTPLTSATDVEIGKPAPAFKAKDINGKEHDLAKYQGKWVVLEWTNHECPMVVGYYKANIMQALQKKYTEKGVIWLSINSGGPGKEGNVSDTEAQAIVAEQKAAATGLIRDEDGTIGHAYSAMQTPTLYVINPKGELAYVGAVDEARPRGGAPEGWAPKQYLADALDAGMAGKPIPVTKTQPRG